VDTPVHRVFLPCVDATFEERPLERARAVSPQSEVSCMAHYFWSVQDVILHMVYFLPAKDAAHLLQVRFILDRVLSDFDHDAV
jgi:hypothetical protein